MARSRKTKAIFGQWMQLSTDLMLANLEAQRVIALRLSKIARGGHAAEVESKRMVTEKVEAAANAAISLATGRSPHSVVRRYRTIMRANERRLIRGS